MLLLPLILLLSTSCRRQEPLKEEQQEVRKYPDQEGWNSMVTSTMNGRV